MVEKSNKAPGAAAPAPDSTVNSKHHSRAFRAAIAEPWAITAEGLDLVLSIAAREHEISVEALEAYRARHVPTSERMTQRGNIAIIDIRGVLFRHANLLTAVSGATSYDIVRRDLQVALDDPSISAIVLSFDTPGGVVNGVNELANAIRGARSQKRIVAYVGGMAASAGYWLASQASEIVIEETAALGSIGVRAVVTDTSKKDAEAGRIEFVSSQSPGKRADLSTDEGRARIQRHVDALADVFIATVAKGRGVKPDDVVSLFGGGDVLIGAAAVAAGMADRLGNFEAVIAELAEGKTPSPQQRRYGAMQLSDDARAERERIAKILRSDAAKNRMEAALKLALETTLNTEEAIGLLSSLPCEQPAAAANPFAGLRRSADAPGGLVTMDNTDAPSGGAVVRSEPDGAAPTAAERNKRMWSDVIKGLNDTPSRATVRVNGTEANTGVRAHA